MKSSICWSSLSIIYLWAHFQLIIGIPMGTRCVPHLAVPVMYSNEAEFMQNTYKRQKKQKKPHKNIKKNSKKTTKNKQKKTNKKQSKNNNNQTNKQIKNTETKALNLTFVYIDDVLSINNPNFVNWIPLIYPKNTTKTASSVSFLDIPFKFDTDIQLYTRHHDKRDDFNFALINFPHFYSNILTASADGVYFSELIHYARGCSLYLDFLQRHRILSTKLLNQGFLKNGFILSFKSFRKTRTTSAA